LLKKEGFKSDTIVLSLQQDSEGVKEIARGFKVVKSLHRYFSQGTEHQCRFN
jgi:hypothetical protein